MAKVGSGSIVTALTCAALAMIGVLAWQADAAPDHAGKPKAGAAHGKDPQHDAAARRAAARKAALALPLRSGQGRRVVYALARHRVWLVAADESVTRTFAVVPGTVAPLPGGYSVNYRQPSITGTDGVPVEDIVHFSVTNGTPIAFDSAVDGSLPTPDPSRKTGGIRERLADGQAMWTFATTGTKVVVVR